MNVREEGSVLDGKYEIQRRLGSGGMGEVYLVRHLHLDERRVIKVLRSEDAADPTAQRRFLRAARTATQIKHPNVAILYDYSSLSDGSFYMVWEYIEGEEVGTWMEKHGPFPVDAALELGVQALRGLGAIHAQGVIHRDISPDNLMLTRDVRGRVQLKIIDLGLAKSLHPDDTPDLEVTQAGMFMGKLRYCSPEQAGMVEGAILDKRSDLYSFAAVLYEMLCGLPPFESETPHGFVFKRLTEDPLPLTGRVPGIHIPRELDEVVRKGLERDREQRYEHAVAFIEALEKVKLQLLRLTTQRISRDEAQRAVEQVERERASQGVPGAKAAPPPAAGGNPSRRESSSQMSRQERDELLAQINRAARRAEKARKLLEQAEAALEAGHREEARQLAEQIERLDPNAKGLTRFKERLEEADAEEDLGPRIQEAEEILARHIESQQLALARLALETLLGLAPEHPERKGYERRIRELAEAEERRERAEKILAEARETLAGGDIKAARRKLTAIRRADPSGELAAAFEAELEAAQDEQKKTAKLTEHRKRFETLLARGRLGDAERQLDQLAELEVTKVSLDLYRNQVAEARTRALHKGQARDFENRFRAEADAGDWHAAREVALEMERALPGHPRPRELLAELETLRGEHERRQAVEQGVRQVEELIAQGQADQAAIALKVLVKLAPDHPKRKQLEKKIAALGK